MSSEYRNYKPNRFNAMNRTTMTVYKIHSAQWLRILLLVGGVLGGLRTGYAQGGVIQLTFSFNMPTCAGASDGTATVTPSGGVAPYTYVWDNNQQGQTSINLVAGVYAVTVTDDAGQTASGSVQVNEPAPLQTSVITSFPSCQGGPGAMVVVATGGTAPYTTLWSNGQIGPVGTGLLPNTVYSAKTTDVRGCQITTAVSVPEIDSLTVSVTTSLAACKGIDNGAATAFVSPPGGAYHYAWNVSPDNVAHLTGLAALTQVAVTVTDQNSGCTGMASAIVLPHVQLSLKVQDAGDVICAGDTTGSATAIASHGTAPYTYQWTGPGGVVFSGNTISGLVAGVYNVTATDDNGCTITGTTEINATSGLKPDFELKQDCANNLITINLLDKSTDTTSTITGWDWTVTFGNSTITGNGQSFPPFTVPNPTDLKITLTVSSAAGCQDSLPLSASVNAFPDISVTTPGFACNGAAVPVTVSGDSTLTYTWLPPTGITFNPDARHILANPATTAVYTLVVSDNGCFDTLAPVTITRQPLIALLANDISSCDSVATLSASSGAVPAVITWATLDSVPVNAPYTVPVEDLPTYYVVTATDTVYQCTEQDTVKVDRRKLAIEASVPAQICADLPLPLSALNMNPADTLTYTWSAKPAALTIVNPLAATTQATGPAGSYTVTLEAVNQLGCRESIDIQVNLEDSIDITNTISYGQACNSTAVTFVNTSGYAGQWTFGDNSTSTLDSVVHVYTDTGTYQVTFIPTLACVLPFAAPVSLTPDIFSVTAAPVTICDSLGAVTAQTNQPATLKWTDLAGNPVNPASVPVGTYMVIATQLAPQCIDTAFAVVASGAVSATASATPNVCTGSPAQLTVSSNNPNDTLTYTWSASTPALVITDPKSDSTSAIGPAGAYTVTLSVVNQVGCTQTFVFPVQVQDSVDISNKLTVDPSCNSLAITAVNTSGYLGTWYFGDNGTSTLDSVTHVYAGPATYSVVFVPNQACVIPYAEQVTLTTDFFYVAANNVTTCDSIGAATAVYNLPASLVWTDLSGNPVNPDSLPLGNYMVVGTALQNQCMDTAFVAVTAAPASIEVMAPPGGCVNAPIELSAENQNPGDTLTYLWASGSPAFEIEQPTSGSTTGSGPMGAYSVTVTATNQYGCTATDSVQLTVIAVNVGVEVTGKDTICTGQSTQLSATATGTADQYTYSWSPGNTLTGADTPNPVATPDQEITYTVTVTGDDLCTATGSVTVYFMETRCEEPYIFVPKAFTPNDDGNNDRFQVRSTVIRDLLFIVYDRWGEEVYRTTDPEHLGWDGTFRGKASTPDSYGWYLQVTCVDGQFFEKEGDVTLLK